MTRAHISVFRLTHSKTYNCPVKNILTSVSIEHYTYIIKRIKVLREKGLNHNSWKICYMTINSGQSKIKLFSLICPLHVDKGITKYNTNKRKGWFFRMYRRINISNYVAEKWLLQLFLVDLIDYDNVLPRKLQLPENV